MACCKRKGKGGTRAHGCDQYYCARLLVTCVVTLLRVCVPDPTLVRHWIFLASYPTNNQRGLMYYSGGGGGHPLHWLITYRHDSLSLSCCVGDVSQIVSSIDAELLLLEKHARDFNYFKQNKNKNPDIFSHHHRLEKSLKEKVMK